MHIQPCGRIPRLLLLGLIPALGACGDGGDRSASDASTFTVRDSAGVADPRRDFEHLTVAERIQLAEDRWVSDPPG